MGPSLSQKSLGPWRVLGALALSTGLLAGSYYLARSLEHPPRATASEEAAALKAIASRDTDSDGLPDWEEALYGTSPTKADTRGLGMTDGEAVAKGLIVPDAIANLASGAMETPVATTTYGGLRPAAEGTLTDVFAKNFFSIYMAKQAETGGNLTEADIVAIERETLDSLQGMVLAAPDFKAMRDLKISGSGPEAMRMYAIAAELILTSNKTQATRDPIDYLMDALENNNPEGYAYLLILSDGYRKTAAGLAQIVVPRELAEEHLALVNALARQSEILVDFTKQTTDPLVSLLALGQYPDTVQGMGLAFLNINNKYKNAGVRFEKGEPGASFAGLIDGVIEAQAKAPKQP